MTTTLALRTRSAPGPAVVGPLLHGPTAAWAALLLNVLPFQGTSIVPIPHSLGQAMAQGALLLALVLAMLANPGMVIRPNVFLTLLGTMAVLALMVSLHNEFAVGSTYRAARLVLFVVVLWLLTPWWGRPELPLLRAHLLCLKVILASVWVGAVLGPGPAFAADGRLTGVVWPMPAPQVAHYCAVLIGCTVVLWFCGLVGGRSTALTLAAAAAALVATHTRTGLLALLLGLVLAAASLFLGHARVRRTLAVVVLAGLAIWTVFSPIIVSWLARGQSAEDLAQLTGRTKVWAAIGARQITILQEFFGTGLGNKSFDGLAIDSNWVATHLELGRVGVALVVAFLLVIFLAAWTRPAGPRRAIAIFLVVYCVVASFTETGLGDASPYLLDLAVAASLVAVPPGLVRRTPLGRSRTTTRSRVI
jgi:O-antigen ligase